MNKQLILLALLALAFAGCKKDEEEPDTHDHGPTNATFKIEYGFHWGAGDFDLAGTYADGAATPHAVKFTTVKFFIGHPELYNAGTEVAHYHDLYRLFDATTPEGEMSIGAMAASTVTELRFTVGLDSAANHGDPTLAAAPLNDASMHWNWNPDQGYKFLVLEGRVDDDGNGVVDDTDPEFMYHCATDEALRDVALAFSGSVAVGGTLAPHMEIMMDQLVTGIDLLASPMGMGYDPAVAQLMDNLANALVIE